MTNYAKVDNEVGNLCNFGQSGISGLAAGQDPQGFSIGVRHVF
jgi:hypothetical protein